MKIAYRNNPMQGIIIKFADGDTVKVILQCNHCGTYRAVYVRLLGIDSYEVKSEHKGRALEIAARYTAKYKGTEVTIIAQRATSDKYARIIGEIYIDKEPLTRLLVKNRDAWYSGG